VLAQLDLRQVVPHQLELPLRQEVMLPHQIEERQ